MLLRLPSIRLPNFGTWTIDRLFARFTKMRDELDRAAQRMRDEVQRNTASAQDALRRAEAEAKALGGRNALLDRKLAMAVKLDEQLREFLK